MIEVGRLTRDVGASVVRAIEDEPKMILTHRPDADDLIAFDEPGRERTCAADGR